MMQLLKLAWRSINRDRFYSLLNIGSLAIGMTIVLFILLWVKDEWTYDLYHENAYQTYRVYADFTNNNWSFETSPYELGSLALQEIPGIKQMTRLQKPFGTSIAKTEFSSRSISSAVYGEASFFDVFDVSVIGGNPKDAIQQPDQLVLTEREATKLFGRKDVVGEEIELNDAIFSVGAVIKNFPSNSSIQYDLFIPHQVFLSDENKRENAYNWGNFNFSTFLILDKGTNPQTVARRLNEFARDHEQENADFKLQPLKDMHWQEVSQFPVFLKGNKQTIFIFLSIGILVLLLACINYVNLTTAKSSKRVKEISVRKIVGAQKGHLFYQLMSETFLLSCLTLLITMGIASFLLPVFNRLAEKTIQFNLMDPVLWFVLGTILLLTSIFTGIYPSLLFANQHPLKMMKESRIPKGFTPKLRKTLVVVQFTFSMVLIISTIVMGLQMRYVHQKNLGFDKEAIFSFAYMEPDYFFGPKPSYIPTLKERLAKQVSIEAISSANQPIYDIAAFTEGGYDWEGKEPGFNPRVGQLSVDPGFKEVFDLELISGRWFDASNRSDSAAFILNQTAVNTFQFEEVIGKNFEFQGQVGKIIGIVKDFNFKSVHEKIGPLIIFNNPGWHTKMYVKCNASQVKEALQKTQATLKQYNPNVPFEPTFVDEAFAQLYKRESKTNLLFKLFASLAVLISCIGLFGLATYHTDRRAKEIGIRKILGANIQSIVILLSKEFVVLILLGVLFAIPIAWYAMSRWLNNFAYNINLAWWIFACGGLILLFIALFTISLQSIKAAFMNPVDRLRSE